MGYVSSGEGIVGSFFPALNIDCHLKDTIAIISKGLPFPGKGFKAHKQKKAIPFIICAIQSLNNSAGFNPIQTYRYVPTSTS